MASEEESTSDSVSVRQVPTHLLNYLRARILHYVAEASEFSAEIHHVSEQAARLVFSMETKPKQGEAEKNMPNVQDDNESTNIILVQNLPSLLDEEVLELFFESTKKKGGGPVSSVKLNREKNWAIVEFFEPEAVKAVMSKRPIKMLNATLDIQSYAPLLHGNEQVKSLTIRGLPKDLTEDILAVHLDSIIDPSTASARTDQVAVDALTIEETAKQTLSDLMPVTLKKLSTTDSVSVRQVPTHLLNYLKSIIIQYVAKAIEFSAEVQHISEQPSRIFLSVGTKPTELKEAMPNVQDDFKSTNTILVQKIPSSLNEEFLELFFESTKKKGGGPVRSVKLNREKHWAIIEFFESEAVEVIMGKTPIQMLDSTLDVQPYAPLLHGDEPIESLDIRGLPKELTEEILVAHLESLIDPSTNSAKTDKVDADAVKTKEADKQIVSDIKPLHLKMLQALNFPKRMEEQFSNLKIRIIHSGNEIIFEGENPDILSSKICMYESLYAFTIHVMDSMPESFIKLFQSKQTMDYVFKKLKTKKLIGVWEVRPSMLTICSFDKDLSSCVKIITQSVKEKKLDVPKDLPISFSLKSSQWQDKVVAMHAKYKGLCIVCPSEDCSKIFVTATDDVVDEIEGAVQTYLKQHITEDRTANDETCCICMETISAPKTLPCGHVFCMECIDNYLANYRKTCPTCGKVCGIIKGDQPEGKMSVTVKKWTHCAGYESCGTIEIVYTFPSGRQGPEHPNPGKLYNGISRVAYLPDNKEGQEILTLLGIAFDRKLVFTVGRSRTTGKDGVITWNDIHQKTDPNPGAKFGYPDPGYFDRVKDELAAKGVTVDDIPQPSSQPLLSGDRSVRSRRH